MDIRYLLIIIVLFVLWGIGLLDLNRHLRKTKRRKKEWAAFLAIGFANIAVALFWLALPANLVSIASIEAFIAQIQSQGILFGLFVLASLGGIWVLGWKVFNDWITFRITSTLILFTAFLVILFANRPVAAPWQVWTTVIFFTLLGLEIILQLLSIPGWLPSFPEFQAGIYHPYGRIYQREEGFTNGIMNRLGLHQPDQAVDFSSNVRRVVLIGGSYLQGFQVPRDQHFAYQLEQHLNEQGPNTTQVFSLGMPDVGIGLYMHDLFLDVVVEKFQPDEIIFFLHASSDFQCESDLFSDPFLFDLVNGTAELRESGERIRHAFQHIVIRGYHDPFDPLRVLKTHLLLSKFLRALLRLVSSSRMPLPAGVEDPVTAFTAYVIRKVAGNRYHYQDFIAVPSINVDGHRNFLFKRDPGEAAESSFALTRNLYHQSFEYLKSKNIKSSVVTIPALSPKFFAQTETWSPLVGEHDLFATERIFEAFTSTEGVDFLGLGKQLKNDQLTPQQIQSLFYNNGTGHFTRAGHKYVAESVLAAFYASHKNNSN